MCNKIYIFFYFRNVHYPKEHNQLSKRPGDIGQVSIFLFEKQPKYHTALGAVEMEIAIMSHIEVHRMTEIEDTFDLKSYFSWCS